MLELLLPGEVEPDQMPETPVVKGLQIRQGPDRHPAPPGPGPAAQFFIPLVVSSYEVGTYTIPSIEMTFGGVAQRTAPVEVTIIDEKKLQLSHATVGKRQKISYFAAFHAMKDKPYVGEKQPVELKIYFPEEIYVIDWGIPEFERDGLSAWRFQPQPRLERATPAQPEICRGRAIPAPSPPTAPASRPSAPRACGSSSGWSR